MEGEGQGMLLARIIGTFMISNLKHELNKS